MKALFLLRCPSVDEGAPRSFVSSLSQGLPRRCRLFLGIQGARVEDTAQLDVEFMKRDYELIEHGEVLFIGTIVGLAILELIEYGLSACAKALDRIRERLSLRIGQEKMRVDPRLLQPTARILEIGLPMSLGWRFGESSEGVGIAKSVHHKTLESQIPKGLGLPPILLRLPPALFVFSGQVAVPEVEGA